MTFDAVKARNAMTDLSGRTALVTGGARGQGETEVRLLAACGAKVMICDVLVAEGEALAAELSASGHEVRFCALDVTSPEAWETVIAEVKAWSGRLDVLVNNAGIINRSLIRDTSPEAWARVLNVNLTGAFLGIRAAADLMAQTGGSVINISSNSGFSGHYDPAYTASKWGLRGLTRSAAMEYAGAKIRVNAICPGLIVTDLNRGSPHLAPMIDLTPAKRAGEAGEVAQLVLWLASDASSFVTGEDFVIDGGFIAGAGYRAVAERTGIL